MRKSLKESMSGYQPFLDQCALVRKGRRSQFKLLDMSGKGVFENRNGGENQRY